MKPTQVLEILKVVAWIVFIGLCIKTGALLVSFFISIFINGNASTDLYQGLDLSDLLARNQMQYILLTGLIIAISGLKAYLFFYVIKITDKLNLINPFSQQVGKYILKMSHLALDIAIITFVAQSFAKWIAKDQINIKYAFDGSTGEFLFLAGILFVIGMIFKRGIELQSENELTI